MDEEPSFGERVAGVNYRERPGSYAILIDEGGRVAVMCTPSGRHLPGGGADPGETPEQTLVREVREECGLTVSSAHWLGRATQNLYAPGEGYFAKRCTNAEAGAWEGSSSAHASLAIPVLRSEPDMASSIVMCPKAHLQVVPVPSCRL